MNVILRTRPVFIAISVTIAMGIQSAAQATKINTDEVMDRAFNMEKAAKAADRLEPEGSKHCGWGLLHLTHLLTDSAGLIRTAAESQRGVIDTLFASL